MPKILERECDVSTLKTLESSVKNKFKWEWLDRIVKLPVGDKNETVDCVFNECLRKIEVPGKVLCIFCNDTVNYALRGVKALESHVTSKKHCAVVKLRRTNYTIANSRASTSSYGIHPMFLNVKKSQEVAKPIVSLEERTKNLEAMVLGVLAENSMPLTMAPVLVDLSLNLAADPKALQQLSMSRTSASYKMKYGLAETFESDTLENIRQSKFSLNIDESTSNNFQRVLCILVSYYNLEAGKIVIEHLESLTMTKVDSQSLFDVMVDLFERKKIPWNNLMSVLMDSCNVMRGSKTGLEKRLHEKAGHLLDIDGDSCHHIHNATKKFCEPFKFWVERMHGDLHNDFKWSPDLREALEEICFILGLKFCMPARMVSHRWLSSYDITVDNLRLFPAFTVFYYAFVPLTEKATYHSLILGIYNKRDLSSNARQRIREIQHALAAKKMTEEGSQRKVRIVQKLFSKRKHTFLVTNFYVAVLPMLKKYVLTYELREPRIHHLYEDQKQLLLDFLSCFVKQESLVGKTAKQLQAMELKPVMLKPSSMFVGTGNVTEMPRSSSKHDKVVDAFLVQAATAYYECASYLQKKLPLSSRLLRCLTSLDPFSRGHSQFLHRMKQLPVLASNVLTAEENCEFVLEAHKFQVDQTLPLPTSDANDVKVDHWWSQVSKTGKYPCCCKMAFALLSCFHGPQVEGSFNTMGDIIDPKSCRLNVETYSAIQTVKYHLRTKGKAATQLFARKDILHSPVNVRLNNNLKMAYKRYKERLGMKRALLEEKKKKLSLKAEKRSSKEKARKVIEGAEKIARLQHIKRLQKLATSRKQKCKI